MKHLSHLGKVAVVSTSLMLAGGYVCYQGGCLQSLRPNGRQAAVPPFPQPAAAWPAAATQRVSPAPGDSRWTLNLGAPPEAERKVAEERTLFLPTSKSGAITVYNPPLSLGNRPGQQPVLMPGSKLAVVSLPTPSLSLREPAGGTPVNASALTGQRPMLIASSKSTVLMTPEQAQSLLPGGSAGTGQGNTSTVTAGVLSAVSRPPAPTGQPAAARPTSRPASQPTSRPVGDATTRPVGPMDESGLNK